MNSQIEMLSSTLVKLKVEIPEAEFTQKYKEMLSATKGAAGAVGIDVKNRTELGKLDNGLSANLIKEICDDYVNKKFPEALLKHKLTPLSKVQFTKGAVERGKGFSFFAEFEVKPEINNLNLNDLATGLTFEPTVTEEMVNASVESLRILNKKLIPITENRPAKTGDFVVIDIKGEMDGKRMPKLSGENNNLEIGKGFFLKDFEDKLVGMLTGSGKQFRLILPQNYPDVSLRGKEVFFTVNLKSINKMELPKFDEKFFKAVMPEVEKQFLNLETLRTSVKKHLEEFEANRLFKENKLKVLQRLAGQNRIDCPKYLLEVQYGIFVDEFKRTEGSKYLPAELEKVISSKKPEFQKRSEELVKIGIIVEWIARQNSFKCNTEDFESFMEKRAKELNMPLAQIKMVFSTPEARNQLVYAIIEDKVVQHLIKRNKKSN